MKGLTQIEKVMHLRRVDLFSHCSAEQIIRIAAIAGERMLEPGEEIYQPSDASEALFCVVTGSVVLEGHRAPRSVSTGETFGVREILSDRLRSCKATASSDTVVLAIEADDFFDLLSDNIEIVKALFRDVTAESPDGKGVSG